MEARGGGEDVKDEGVGGAIVAVDGMVSSGSIEDAVSRYGVFLGTN